MLSPVTMIECYCSACNEQLPNDSAQRSLHVLDENRIASHFHYSSRFQYTKFNKKIQSSAYLPIQYEMEGRKESSTKT